MEIWWEIFLELVENRENIDSFKDEMNEIIEIKS